MTPQEIIKSVSKQFGVSVEEILSPRRSQYVYRVRVEVIKKLHDIGMSSMEIGRFLNRDHSTIIHALKSLKI